MKSLIYIVQNLILRLFYTYLKYKFFQENETRPYLEKSLYLEKKKIRRETYKNTLINIKHNDHTNTYLDLRIQRGKSHQPQCACTSKGSSQYYLQQRMNLRQHLSYKALFPLENSEKDERLISKTHIKDIFIRYPF